ncbi:hypothetical protein BC937DRAFT_87188 [Endogone sp. FLAS-F59071]|nr:hypothetical protein BC937DRAFT_87188 [Endogone sp. FLAS-F59071]|eukprot:RUS12721.1 hypothetical protein BC937DRAFT_87188 [Endogone sp. FLAS-F59071]
MAVSLLTLTTPMIRRSPNASGAGLGSASRRKKVPEEGNKRETPSNRTCRGYCAMKRASPWYLRRARGGMG